MSKFAALTTHHVETIHAALIAVRDIRALLLAELGALSNSYDFNQQQLAKIAELVQLDVERDAAGRPVRIFDSEVDGS